MNVKPKIIVISMSPYEELIVHNHYFQKEFEDDGYEFEYWSISEFVGFNYMKSEFSFTRYFTSVEEVVEALRSETKPFYCNIQIALTPDLYPIFEAVEQNAIKFYELRYLDGSLSIMNKDPSGLIKRIKNKLDPKTLKKRIKLKLFLEKYKRSKVSQRMVLFNPPGVNSKPELEIHHFDYTINNNMDDSVVDGEYFLFIDQGLPLHPDFHLLGKENIDKEIYLKEMNKFFDYIESKFKIPIVIAPHPKVVYNKNDFKHREMIKYKTAMLTKNAKAIFTHFSTSFNYAILNNRPIVLLTMNEFYNKENGTGLHNKIGAIKNISNLFN